MLLNPVFGRQEALYYHCKETAFERAVLEMVQLLQIFNKNGFNENADKKYIMRKLAIIITRDNFLFFLILYLCSAAFNQQYPCELHDVLFIPTLEVKKLHE